MNKRRLDPIRSDKAQTIGAALWHQAVGIDAVGQDGHLDEQGAPPAPRDSSFIGHTARYFELN